MFVRLYFWLLLLRFKYRLAWFDVRNKSLKETDRLSYILNMCEIIDHRLYVNYRPSVGVQIKLTTRFPNAWESLDLLTKMSKAIRENDYLDDRIMRTIFEPVERQLDMFLVDNTGNEIDLSEYCRLFLQSITALITAYNNVKGDGALKPYYQRRLKGVFIDALAILEALQSVALREWVKT